MDFRIRKNDPYLDFFRNQGISEDLGDPYDPIPEEILRDREFELNRENNQGNDWDQYLPQGQDESLPEGLLQNLNDNKLVKSFGRGISDFGHFLKEAVTHPIDTAGEVIQGPFKSALSGVEDAMRIATRTPKDMDLQTAAYAVPNAQQFAPEMLEENQVNPVSAGLKIGLPLVAPGSEIFARPLGNIAEGEVQEGLGELAALGVGGALLHAGGKGLGRVAKKVPEFIEKTGESLPLKYEEGTAGSGLGGFNKFGGGKNDPTYQGQPVKVLGRRGSSVKIELPSGQVKTVGFSELGKPNVGTKTEAPKSKYSDLVKELDEIDKSLGETVEDVPAIDPQDVSIVAPDANILPEYGYPTKPGRPGKQGPPKPPKPPDEFIDEGGGEEKAIRRLGDTGPYGKYKGEDVELRELGEVDRSIKEGSQIEKGQNKEIIQDQGFRDQILLQDEILKQQEQEALKAGKAEEAHKASLERKILRAQNDEIFQQFKKEEADRIRSEKEQNSYQRRLLKEQEAEDLASRELKQKVAGHGESIKPEGWKQQALDIFRVPIAYRASGDIPALSHARFDTLAHPIESFKRLKNEALPAVFSEKKQQEVFDRITNNDKFDSAMKGGLEFTKQGYDPGAQSFGSYTAENLPVGGQVVKASQRGQNVYLDDTRMTRFEQLMNDAGVDSFGSDSKATKQIADFVNTVTGYGKIDNVKAESVLRAANSIFWSTRKRVARVQHLKLLGDALNPASDMLPTLRKEVARQAIPTIGIGVGLLALMEQAGAKVDWDWRNSNFMKARFPTKSGKWLAWTPFGDYMTTVKLLAQQASGKKITDKGEYDLDNPKGIFDPTRTSILSDYAYNALNPSSRVVLDALNPKTELAGSPFLDVDEYPNASKALELMTPINVSNQGEMYKELGPVSSLFAPLTGIGEGIDINDPEHFAKMRARAQGKPYSPKKKGKRKGKILSIY